MARDVRIGFVSAWMDPTDPHVWSGIPAGLMRGLDELGVFAGYFDGTPWHRGARLVHRVRTRGGRRDPLWMLRPEMRAMAALSNVARHALPPARPDAWVQPMGAFGRPMPGPFAVIVETTPHQLTSLHPQWSRSFWPYLGDDTLESLARQQRRVLRRARACCAASTWAAESLVREHGVPRERVHVVGYGRNVDLPIASRSWDAPRFLFVGREWARKNGALVVRAFARVRAEVPRARLDVVGRHPRLDVDGVVAHGELSYSDARGRAVLDDLFANATCFVLPSHVEPFGIAYVEAAAAGVPSIGTSVGGTPDSVGDGGVLVDPSDEGALVDAMLRLSDPATAQALGARALARSGRFTWRAVAARVVAALMAEPGVPVASDRRLRLAH